MKKVMKASSSTQPANLNSTPCMKAPITMTSSTHSVETNAPQPMATPSEACAQSSPLKKSRPSRHARCRSTKQSQTYYLPTILLLTIRHIAAEDGSFTGQWNGEWTANSNSNNMYDDDAVGDENRVYSMWYVLLLPSKRVHFL